ncbi:hypothetical protein WKY82_12185 [Gordonia malaquae]|uniref:hypothetical protein n=1 Tax=Gordonia malaquae TaxID=410332 RepID=UPI0030C78CDC
MKFTRLRCIAVAAFALAATASAVPAVTHAEPTAGSGIRVAAATDDWRCTVTLTMKNYTNAHNWYTLDYWFAQEDQPWAPTDAELISGYNRNPGYPNPLPAPWRLIAGAKEAVGRYTPPNDEAAAANLGSLRSAVPADFPAEQRYGYGGVYTNFNAAALTTPYTTKVTFDLRTVTPAPPVTSDGTYTIRYRVYLGPQTQALAFWKPRSITVRGCKTPTGSSLGSSDGSWGSSVG